MRYRHYKGGTYSLVCEALHTETREKMVVYRNGTEFYARPFDLFHGNTSSGQKRFEPLAFKVLIIESRGQVNVYRQVDVTRAELDELKKFKCHEKYHSVPPVVILPDGLWDYILSFEGRSDANIGVLVNGQ